MLFHKPLLRTVGKEERGYAMSFEFFSTDYHLHKAWGVDKWTKGARIMEDMIRAHADPRKRAQNTPNRIYEALKTAGVGYRKTNCLQDISRAMAIEHSYNVQSYDRAEKWWKALEHRFDEHRDEKRHGASLFMKRYKQKTYRNEEEAREAREMDKEGWMEWKGSTPVRL